MQSELEGMGFTSEHARRIAAALVHSGIARTDGLRFVVSGQVTSVFLESRIGQTLVCQVEAPAPEARFIADAAFGGS